MEPPEDRAAHETRPSTGAAVPPPDGEHRPDDGEHRPDDGRPGVHPAGDDGRTAEPPRTGAPLPAGRPPLGNRPLPDRTPPTGGLPLPQEVPVPGDRDRRAGEGTPAGGRIPDGPRAHASDGTGSGDGDDGTDGEAGENGALGRLSLPGRLVVALAVAAVAVGAIFHIGMVFLHVAPANTLSTEHAQAVTDYIYPEFEQNWKLFAPDPVQINTDVEARAAISTPSGGTSTTGWVDLTAMDIAKIKHDPIPSHTVQNELRRAWDFYTSAHDAQDRPIGLRGTLSQQYLLRIVAQRFGQHVNGGTVQRFQVRVATTPVASPNWSAQKIATGTSYRLLSWWTVTPEDFT